jgi:hypothetical protein
VFAPVFLPVLDMLGVMDGRRGPGGADDGHAIAVACLSGGGSGH